MKISNILGCLGLSFILLQVPATARAFDFDTGNAAVEIVIPTVAPVIFTFANRG